jgi:hypothetical protein
MSAISRTLTVLALLPPGVIGPYVVARAVELDGRACVQAFVVGLALVIAALAVLIQRLRVVHEQTAFERTLEDAVAELRRDGIERDHQIDELRSSINSEAIHSSWQQAAYRLDCRRTGHRLQLITREGD